MPNFSTFSLVAVVLVTLLSCSVPRQSDRGRVEQSARCFGGNAGTEPAADIISLARHALGNGTADSSLRVDTIIHVNMGGQLHEGSVVRLVPSVPPPRYGVGGLVWVDAETRCAVVMKRYE